MSKEQLIKIKDILEKLKIKKESALSLATFFSSLELFEIFINKGVPRTVTDGIFSSTFIALSIYYAYLADKYNNEIFKLEEQLDNDLDEVEREKNLQKILKK